MYRDVCLMVCFTLCWVIALWQLLPHNDEGAIMLDSVWIFIQYCVYSQMLAWMLTWWPALFYVEGVLAGLQLALSQLAELQLALLQLLMPVFMMILYAHHAHWHHDVMKVALWLECISLIDWQQHVHPQCSLIIMHKCHHDSLLVMGTCLY